MLKRFLGLCLRSFVWGSEAEKVEAKFFFKDGIRSCSYF